MVPLYSLLKGFRLNAVQRGEIAVKHDLLISNQEKSISDPVFRNYGRNTFSQLHSSIMPGI